MSVQEGWGLIPLKAFFVDRKSQTIEQEEFPFYTKTRQIPDGAGVSAVR
jgi:hypothetical protein